MAKESKYYTITEVAQIFNATPNTIRRLIDEGFVCCQRGPKNTRLFSQKDLERVRTILVLYQDLGVNWAGVEVILHMRERMINMQKQVKEIFDYLYMQMEEVLAANRQAPGPEEESKGSLIEIIEVDEKKE